MLRDALKQAREAGILVVVAAGKTAPIFDLAPIYPASYGAAPDFLPNIVAVTGTSRQDRYGADFNMGRIPSISRHRRRDDHHGSWEFLHALR